MTILLWSCGNVSKKSSEEQHAEAAETGEEDTPLGMFAYEDYRPQFEYEILLDASRTEVMGVKVNPFNNFDGELVIKENHPVFGKEFWYFDEEENYNDFIGEWILASYLSILMVDRYSDDWENNKDKITRALSFVGELPNTEHIEDPEIAGNFKKAYYDLMSLDIFMPRERYGIKAYPIGIDGKGISVLRGDIWIHKYHYATLQRITGKENLGVEDGVLGIGLNERSYLF